MVAIGSFLTLDGAVLTLDGDVIMI
jgi:hypothetical protein